MIGVVLYTNTDALKGWSVTLSIKFQRCIVYGIDNPYLVVLDIPDHHTFEPKVDIDKMHTSTADKIVFGVAPRLTGFRCRRCQAVLSAL